MRHQYPRVSSQRELYKDKYSICVEGEGTYISYSRFFVGCTLCVIYHEYQILSRVVGIHIRERQIEENSIEIMARER